MNFQRTGYGRIYVENAEDIPRVRDIILAMDEFEFGYLPSDLIAPWAEYPKVTYTHKFDSLNTNDLTAICWSRGIKIWACFTAFSEHQADATKLAPEATEAREE